MASNNQYPSGLNPHQRPPGFAPYLTPNDESDQVSIGDDPSFETTAYLEMSAAWFSIDCVVGGTAFFRTNASTLLPREPQELEDAWKRRVSHATLSPYTVRIAEQAAGLILRKGIVLSNKTQDADVDPYWEEFADSIDGRSTDLIAFARRVLISSLLYGHAGILVDYPTSESSGAIIDMIASTIRSRKLPLLTILGANVDYEKLRRFEELLPVSIGRARLNETQVFTDITPGGQDHPATGLSDSGVWSEMPPIFRNETSFTPRPESQVLATARIGSSSLDEPLIVSRKLGNVRSLMIAGHGIWRWDLIGEGKAEAAGREQIDLLDKFAAATLRWLAVREEEKQVRIKTSKKIYNLGESVRFLGQVYDESYQPLNNADVTVRVEGPDGGTELTLVASGSGRYEGILSNLPAGDYRFTGEARVGGNSIGSDGGRFVIDEIGIEFLQTSMNVPFLRALAERTGGKFYTYDQTGSLVEDIQANKAFTPRSIEQSEEWSMRESIWFLIAALTLFSIEWFIRKRSGML